MPADSGQASVQQMFATLLGEIASLRKQNEEQQRQLEHLRGDMSFFLERSNKYPQPPRMPHFKCLPLEIREMIWELAVPIRLLGFEGVTQKKDVASALSVPTVAHVCRESRNVVMSRKSLTALSGRSTHLDGQGHLWRLRYSKSALWTWFTPCKDALFINPCKFQSSRPFGPLPKNHLIVQAAEHIVIEDYSVWDQFFEERDLDDENIVVLKRLSNWVPDVVLDPENTGSTRHPICNLRTVDFAMSRVTKIDRNYPPNFVRRLFSEDHVRIVDLRDECTVRGIDHMLSHELSQVMDKNTPMFDFPTDLEQSFNTYRAAAGNIFSHVRASLLHALALRYHQASRKGGDKSVAALPSPFRDGILDMEVTWVKELTKRVNVRPVHVFVRAEGMSNVYW